ncbi:MAG: thioesterase domain-containing protein, partial [bacterium]
YLHAGIVTTIVDSACGYAAFSLMEAGADVLTIEFKINFLSPALGEIFIAKGLVTKPGKNITVCLGDVIAKNGDKEKIIATMLATIMTIRVA